MEKAKEMILGIQMKNIKSNLRMRNRKRLFKKVVEYLKSDSYMFAPLLNSPSSPSGFVSPKAKINSSSTKGLEIRKPFKGKKKKKNKKLVKKIVDYLKSDSYMYASMFAAQAQPLADRAREPIRYVKRVTMEISTTTLTMEDNQPTIQSKNVIAEDQTFEGSIPETILSGPLTGAQKEVVKNMVYSHCRSSSISGKAVHEPHLRKLVVD